MQETAYKPIKILSIDGSDVYRAMHRVDGALGLTVKDKNGRLDTSRFRGFLDASLDTDQMKKAYAKHKELPGSFRVCKDYTTAVVNVSFDFSVKAFYNKGKQLFVRDGYDVQWDMLRDHVLVNEENGRKKLIAIEVADDTKESDPRYAAVEEPLTEEMLGSFFFYDAAKKAYYVKRRKHSNGTLTRETLIPTKETKREVRAWL